MGKRHVRHLIALVAFLALVAGTLEPAEAAEPPSLKLIGTTDPSETQSFVRYRKSHPVYVDLGAWLMSVGGAFELRASRDETYGPISFRQVDEDDPNNVFRTLDPALMDDWYGLKDFLQIVVTDANDVVVSDQKSTWCPNGFEHERTGDAGPDSPRYPYGCWGMEFTRGVVWGIDAGWAVNPTGYEGEGNAIFVPDGTYDVTLKIADDYQDLFGIAEADAETSTSIVVKTKKKRRRHRPQSSPHKSSGDAAHVSPPTDLSPDPAWLPDLQALPARYITMDNIDGKNELTFGATEWNAGPQPMVIEGFRPDTETETMAAHQYFYENGVPVAQDPDVGELEYHEGGGHDHWHFQQFVSYELITGHDGLGLPVAESGKQAWCLVPTDAIDMTVPNANWRPENTDLGTACGGRRSLWVREILDVGHGDTYYQVSGQAFDVTNLPNGNYQVRIEVNPDGEFHESDTSNNVSLRDIVVSGSGDNREVTVLPYYGIDG